MSRRKQPLFDAADADVLETIIADAALVTIITDFANYRGYGGRHNFATWWQRYADNYAARGDA